MIAMYTLSTMQPCDLPEELDIQRKAYDDNLQESLTVIAQRLKQASNLAIVAKDQYGICGYLFSYRPQIGAITALDDTFNSPDHSDCLYLHNFAVAPYTRKRGVGPDLVKHKLSMARQASLQQCSLVSMQNSASFWQRIGFKPQLLTNQQQKRALKSYGVPAVYMQRSL